MVVVVIMLTEPIVVLFEEKRLQQIFWLEGWDGENVQHWSHNRILEVISKYLKLNHISNQIIFQIKLHFKVIGKYFDWKGDESFQHWSHNRIYRKTYETKTMRILDPLAERMLNKCSPKSLNMTKEWVKWRQEWQKNTKM